VGAFLVCAIAIGLINSAPFMNDSKGDRKEVIRDRQQWQDRVNAINWWLLLPVLGLLLLVAAGAVLGLWETGTMALMLVAVGVLCILLWGGVTLYSAMSEPPDAFDDWLQKERLPVILSHLAMLLAVIVVASYVGPGSSDWPMRYLFLFVAAPIVCGYYVARGWLLRFAGRAEDAYVEAAPPALGVFIAGAVLLLFANHLLQ
jgi:uncharacterized membrane protein